jgi:hypothetical protein
MIFSFFAYSNKEQKQALFAFFEYEETFFIKKKNIFNGSLA